MEDTEKESSKSLDSHPLSPDQIQETLKDILEKCEVLLPGKTSNEKKAWCIKRVRDFLEMFDNYIPVIGMFLDNPIVDDLETQAVNLLVEWAWDNIQRDSTDTKKQTEVSRTA